jgi:membrane protein implicated in regulation of membrane protease activity
MGFLDSIADFVGVSAPSAIEIVFVACAFFGTIFLLLMMVLMLVGDIFGGVVDSAFDADISLDSTTAMELFSIQGIAAAIMMFGMTGMFTMESTGIEVLAVIIGGISAVGSLFMVKNMLKGIKNLQADGTMRHDDAIGKKGQVYSRIRKNSTGEIQVSVNGTLRTVEARAMDKNMHIPTGELIKVVDVIGATMIVEPLNNDEFSSTEEE